MVAFRLFLITLFFPLLTIAMLWRRPRHPRSGWLASLILASALVGFSFFTAPWGWFGLPVRYLLVVLLLVAAVLSYRRPPIPPAEGESAVQDASPIGAAVKILIAIFIGSAAVTAVRGRSVPPQPLELAFPLRGGSFLVQHGGSTTASNLHHMHPTQKYGLDITGVNRLGMRARGLYPADLSAYAIFGAEVLSPCNGSVLVAQDGLPDLPPGTADAERPAGNHLVLRCGDADVWLAHLQNGSVSAVPGAPVTTGELVGRVGNSGNTTEPHLHVHAERNKAPVAVRFDGRWLVRNDVVRR